MLTLQIAAGIVLAYAIIANRFALLRALEWSFNAIVVVGGTIALGIGAIWLLGLLGSYWRDIVNWAAFIAALAMGLAGGYGLRVLFRHFFPRRKGPKPPNTHTDGDDPTATIALFGWAVLNMLLLWGLSWPLYAYTPFGGWWDDLDAWSRANGWDDLWTVFFGTAFMLWPFIPLSLLTQRRNSDSEGSELLPTPTDAENPI